MDTLGPVSVLDSGRRTRDAVLADRITRRRSPDRPRLKAAHSDLDVVYRIPQPYRTSFSAKHSVERLPGSDRSRSLSPASSLRSVHSSRSERTALRRHHHHHHHQQRAKSPKRVTYDTRVTVRHSEGEDSMFTEPSSREYECERPGVKPQPGGGRHVSKDSGLDYSTQLRDLSDQILNWSHRDPDPSQHPSPPSSSSSSILKESQNSHKHSSSSSARTPTSSRGPPSTPTGPQNDKENDPSGSPVVSGDSNPGGRSPAAPISREYQHDRTLSYRRAIHDHYSSEVRALVDAGVEETPPASLGPSPDGRENGALLAQQRSSSVSVVSREACTPPSNQLTPAKRSVSTSISNFFKRISPHLGRKRTKDRSNNGSRAGSSQSLPAAAGVTMDPETPSPTTTQTSPPSSTNTSSGHFSRSRIRNSFLKLMGGPRKDSKSKVSAAINSSSSPQSGELNTSGESACDKNNTSDSEAKPQVTSMPQAAQRKLKSMEKNQPGKDVYREFKDKRSPHGSSAADASLEERYRAIKAQYKDRPRALEDELSFDEASTSPQYPSSRSGSQTSPSGDQPSCDEGRGDRTDVLGGGEDMGRAGKAEPPSSLDVVPPRAIRLLQASTVSTISGDESIGECSLDCNLTASQPSLLSGTSQSAGSNLSKKAVLNQSLISSTESQLPDPAAPASQPAVVRRQKDTLVLGQSLDTASPVFGDKENASPLSPLSPAGGASSESGRKPSYLKLSCAVSGYGKYSRYSSYKNIPTRSPFSSTSSLRSDLSSPDPTMPSLRSPDDSRSPIALQSAGCSPSGAGVMATTLSNGQSRLLAPALNGHAAAQAPGMYPTGDPVKDGDYFLAIMASEEERLNQQCKRAEGLMRSQDLPEEVNGRIRAAIGKSNLLISQKFQQFKELCSQHMHPDPEERIPLYEDLQGFWDMIKIQVDNVDDNFAEIDHMSQNGWKEIPKLVPSRRSSASSSPKSGSLSQTSTPSVTPGHTPGSRRRGLKANNKDTPDSSPEHAEKMRSAAKARDEARKRMLAEKRAAMKQQQQQQQQQQAATPDIEIFLPDSSKK